MDVFVKYFNLSVWVILIFELKCFMKIFILILVFYMVNCVKMFIFGL